MSNEGRNRELRHRLTAIERNYSVRPYGVVVTTTNPEEDTLAYNGPRAGRTIPISHPYLGPGSWIRVMPERATRAIINSRADSGESFVEAYIAENSAAGRIRSTYERQRFYYRRLREGEIDMMSTGLAEVHLGSGGTVSLRAGPMSHIMNVEQLESNASAPTFIRRGLDNFIGDISDEVRFGVVKRLTGEDDSEPVYIRVTPENSDGEVFAKEYLRHVKSKAPPFTLIDHREGHVIDNTGNEQTSTVTGKKLRSRTAFGTVEQEETIVEVDEEGNYNLSLPDNASYGLNINVNRTDVKVICGRDEVHTVGRNLFFDVEQNAKIEADTKIELEAPRINSGANADEPMLRGNQMHTWLDGLTVLTAMGPASINDADITSFPGLVQSTKSFVE